MIIDKHHEHIENDPHYGGLKVNDGIEMPPPVNADSVSRFLQKKKKRKLSAQQYVDGILQGDVTILSQAVTLVESSKPDHQEIAQEIILKCLPHTGNSVRVGITGVPGVGKSTFIEAMGTYITAKGSKLAVLAIDPSSERTKGSILGDKTRMEELSGNPHAYIRPSPSAGSLGGVARKTRETIILCEAAGFDTIFIETVGVGQSETAVHSMVDFFLLLMLAGAGDELQGIKRGIMEMADAIAINKADGNNMDKAGLARIQYENALHLFPPTPSGWKPKVLTCSAFHKKGIDQVWETITEYLALAKENNYFHHRRNEQSKYWMYESINEQLKMGFYENPEIKSKLPGFESKVLNDELSSFVAARELIDRYRQLKK
ncbi:MAG: ATPase/protein kinase [Bacteroidetes bacterium GWF2_42_66]|nr:MAG: ATPase/protein kinase [Bacteroidetes bacterium GWA2_42_15]OFY00994.1 MAG: ATPase/protein kinase [Bacteroidetes bacterium GWE2_42_39]OFY41834.1 MAG: ATPase/protein kinase [Bacteroidetes bacterium GWF2_42_66]HBL77994.1 methylmalonyl Co-A mutase-associated GTPase MeaB [Prolixibacteraceae bacterium]HCR90243.1 methylmalonyl Co-A mutase-associated GTPase MeaB [Prolixibacteraceae bacterium]